MSHTKTLLSSLDRLRIEHYILNHLRGKFLRGNFEHITMRSDSIEEFMSEYGYTWESVREQIFLAYGREYLDIRRIDDETIEHVAQTAKTRGMDVHTILERDPAGMMQVKRDIYYNYLFEAHITRAGFDRLDMIDTEILEHTGWRAYLTLWREKVEILSKIKAPLAVGFTLFLIILILVFNVRVSSFIESIPLLSSVINTTVLKEFEDVSTNDDYYQALAGSMERTIGRDNTANTSNDTPNSIVNIRDNSGSYLAALPYPKDDIQKVQVKVMAPEKKLFRIILKTGEIRYVTVEKGSDGKYTVSDSDMKPLLDIKQKNPPKQ